MAQNCNQGAVNGLLMQTSDITVMSCWGMDPSELEVSPVEAADLIEPAMRCSQLS